MMIGRKAALAAVTMFGLQCLTPSAFAENQMGYNLLTADQAAQLPRRGGALRMEVGRAQQITDGGMTFELLRVNAVRRGSSGAQAGLHAGDQIIAVDGRVFPTVAAFAAYIGSTEPGRAISVDYIPAGGGPGQAQRVGATIGDGGRTLPSAPNDQQAQQGMSAGKKLAIGAAAAALFGCYELGCFSRARPTGQLPQPQRQ